jgi:hypothetical protein
MSSGLECAVFMNFFAETKRILGLVDKGVRGLGRPEPLQDMREARNEGVG